MALKSYHQETLNDNWYEERAEPLNGVLPHDGVKEYSTTTKVEFTGAKPLAQRMNPRMVNERSLGQALLQSTGASISNGFRSALPPPNEDQERRYLQTTYSAAFGTLSTHSKNLRHTTQAMPAGGAGGRPNERGKSTSGSMGEVYRTSTEPQKDTASQRSWLYSVDPMITAKQNKSSNNTVNVRTSGETQLLSHPNHKRKSTSITNVPFSHNGVFTDD